MIITMIEGRFPIIGALLLTMVWPAAAIVSLSVAVGVHQVTLPGISLAACGVAAAYGLDRLIDRRGRDPSSLRRALMIGVALAAAGTGILACTAWWRFKVCAVLSLIAGAYVPLKKYIPKNVLTTTAWTSAVATLPFSGLPHQDPAFRASVLAVACIMAANTILCDLPDVADDRASGVRGIAPRFGARTGALVGLFFGITGAIVAGLVGRWGLSCTSVALAVIAMVSAADPSRGHYRKLADAVVTVVPGPVAFFLG